MPKDYNYRKQNINNILSMSLEQKIEHAKNRIREFYTTQNGKVYIAFSGGKDSTVLLHLVRSIYPDVVAVFSNTTNEYLEILQFVKTIDNVIELKPKMSFNQVVNNYGFPLVSKKVARQIHDLRNSTDNNVASRNLYMTGIKRDGTISKSFKLSKKWHKLIYTDFNITNKCCDILKKDPFKRYEKESDLVPFVGTTIEESGLRKMSWLTTGCNSYDKDIKSRPISIFTEQNIWEYIKLNNLDYCEIYNDLLDDKGNIIVKKEVRTGCAYCSFGLHLEKSDLFELNRLQRLAIRKPHQHKRIMNLKNNGVTYREALKFIGVNNV